VTVAAQAMNHWVGALGGMFILVDYFLTAAISCLSGILYLSVVFPAMGPFAVAIAIGTLVLLGILNCIGVSESAKVSLVGAVIAFFSDIALLITVFLHLSLSELLALFPRMFASHALTPISILIGFAGSFLAFSGLESISQLSPVMKTPRKKVGGMALLLVVITIGLTSPLITLLSTLLLPQHVLTDPVLSAQAVSLLAGYGGGIILQTEVAISASALLVFASNTAIIGTYHVFIALSRMQFFPTFILKRNTLRNTPHYSILLATVIPIAVLLLVKGNIALLGDMYAFGLLGAFTLTCLGLDIVRYRERKAARKHPYSSYVQPQNGKPPLSASNAAHATAISLQESPFSQEHRSSDQERAPTGDPLTQETPPSPYAGGMMLNPWYTFKFSIGLLTTLLVFTAWTTNLIAKPLATAFGGTITIIGMGIAYFNYARHKREGFVPVVITHIEEYLPGSTLAVLTPDKEHNEAVIHAAIDNADGKPIVFLYLGSNERKQVPRMFEYHNPYHEDQHAQEAFGRAAHLAQKSKVARRFLYRLGEFHTVEQVWQNVQPHALVVAADTVAQIQNINPDRIRYESTFHGKVAYVLKSW
jgi:amino acid transporter